MKRISQGRLDYIKERRVDFDIYRSSSADVERLLEHLLPDPDLLLSQGTPIRSRWQSKVTAKVRVQICEKSYFLKRYNCTGWLYRLKNLFRPSKALRSWRATQLFLQHNIPTLPPLLCLEERRCSLLGRSYLLYPFLGGDADNLLAVWPTLVAEAQEGCIVEVAKIIGKMHSHGIVHGDLNWRNILLARDDAGFDFYLVDLDDSRLLVNPTRKDLENDLRHFCRDMERSNVPHLLRDLFMENWRCSSMEDAAETV